ncbi:MAG TPA: LysR family transcriptional regulator [Steroidobacteraceae bacterium]|nr:LysR family transcriptional regulator [Steroidobacteraceae bacterium]
MQVAEELACFAKVLELGSFTAAAKALGVPKVRVSRSLVALEKRFGVRLLERTTRRIALTAAGALLLPHCQRIAAEAEAAVRLMRPAGRPGAELRVIADSAWGRLLLTPLVPRFLELDPARPLQLEVVPERPTEPAADWDVLVCNGAPEGAAFAVRPLGRPELLLCATAGYLQAQGAPASPADLADHALLIAAPAHTTQISLVRGQERRGIAITPRLVVADPQVVHASTAAGLGIGVLPEFLCRQGLAMGRLHQVLAGWRAAEIPELCAVCDARRADEPAIRGFIDFLAAQMVPVLSRSGR